MGAWWENAIQAGLQGGGSLLWNHRNAEGAWNRQQEAQNFNVSMFRNRYQMEVADLKAAGLNPMLAYGHGPGQPGGSSPAGTPQSSNPGEALVEGFNKSRIASAQEAQMEEATRNIEADTAKKAQETETLRAQQYNTEADTLIKADMPKILAGQLVHSLSSAAQADAMSKKLTSELQLVNEQIKETQSRIQKNKADTALQKGLTEQLQWKNQLLQAEKYLTDARARQTWQGVTILSPKEKQAGTTSAEIGAAADNIKKIGDAVKSFTPFRR